MEAHRLLEKDDLLAVTDGVMLDIKAFGEEDHLKVTAMPNKNTLENAVFLAKMGKLFEIRTVIVPGLFDIENTIIKAGELLRPYQSIHPVRYKLISYRPFWRQGRVQDLSESVKGVIWNS